MNLFTLRDNVKRLIAQKEKEIEAHDRQFGQLTRHEDRVANSTAFGVLRTNLNELRTILADVELCYKKESDESWVTNPDRMGGQFTDAEIDEPNSWR